RPSSPGNSSYWQLLAGMYSSVPAWPYVSSGQEAMAFSGFNLVRLTYQGSDYSYSYAWKWSTNKTYTFNDVVYYDSNWYRCLATHYNTGNWTYNVTNSGAGYWARVPTIWAWSSSLNYNLGDVVYHSGTSTWYRCTRA